MVYIEKALGTYRHKEVYRRLEGRSTENMQNVQN